MVRLGSNLLFLIGAELALGGLVQRAPSPTVESPAVVTPQPTQPGITSHCAKFHYVRPGETCNWIAERYSISVDRFIKWNPGAGRDCTTLWANTYACVAVIRPWKRSAGEAKGELVEREPTKTQYAREVTTPRPIQPGMVGNCNRFYYVRPGENCNVISSYYDISVHDFLIWNPGAGQDCTTLWANTYACVGIGDD